MPYSTVMQLRLDHFYSITTEDDAVREYEEELAIALSPAVVAQVSGTDWVPPSPGESGGVTFQRCGGGRRVLRKRIGAN